MSWCRAVWREGKQEEEGVVPSHWVQKNVVRWPRVTNATKFLKERTTPMDAWWRLPLIKVKTTSGALQFLHFDRVPGIIHTQKYAAAQTDMYFVI